MSLSKPVRHQHLPSAGPERELLRQKGQFWTPDWVAEAMAAYVLQGGSGHVFDPAVGGGAFFRAARDVSRRFRREVLLLGSELDPAALDEARSSGLSEADLSQVQIRDFVLSPPERRYGAILANPPYLRHHRLSPETKEEGRRLSESLLGVPIDARAGLHVYFLLRALERLDRDGRLAFIMPADTAEGVFAAALWNWITSTYDLEAVLTFAPEATPFPGVDTNALVFLIRNRPPRTQFQWVRCSERGGLLYNWIAANRPLRSQPGLEVLERSITEGVQTGLSRPPLPLAENAPRLGDFVRVVRGIATGANEYFFLTRSAVRQWQIPAEFLRSAVGRTRDVTGEILTRAHLDALDAQGRPTLLFSPDGRELSAFPDTVQLYLKHGEEQGYSVRTLLATRNPWYKMETRNVPAFLFAYLGRRNTRFIRNMAGVVPLSGFLCVYPKDESPEMWDRLWHVLREPATSANLARVGKSYGEGAIKVEPRALESLPLPPRIVEEARLR